ncbi:MAG TPA: T9SS type A sorting domain-containing protein [Chitinophagales bacterium]|nr:T9SS type A sorting domain-containing protein [Chitinophagales bacterium]
MNKKLPFMVVLLVLAHSLFSQNIVAYDWAKLIGADGGNDLTWDITSDGAGNVYIAGKFTGDSADFDPGAGEAFLVSAGNDDIFLAKYTNTGQLLWAKAMGTEENDEARSLVLDEDGNIWITGTFSGTGDFDPGSGVQNLSSAGYRDIFLAKYDQDGDYLWAGAMGGNGDDVANKIARHPITGDVWICGGFEGSADFDPSANDFALISMAAKDIFFARYNVSGGLIGARRIQGSANDQAMSISFDTDGNLLLCGVFVGTVNFNPTGTAVNLASNNDSNDGFVAKYDLSATLLWVKALGGKTNTDFAINVTSDNNNNVIVCGYYSDTCEFQPGVGAARRVGLGVADAYVANYDATGNYRGVITYGAPGEYVVAWDVATDNDGYIYATGYASSNFDAGNDIGTPQIIDVAGKNAYLLKYDLYGNFLVGANISYGAASVTGYCTHVDAQGGILVGGELQGTGDMDPSVLTKNLTSSSGNRDAFWARYFNCSIPGQVFYTSDTVCQGRTAQLAAGASFGYTIGWYADEQATVFLAENQYTTPVLNASTVYYLMDSVCGIKKVTPVTALVNPAPDNVVTLTGATLSVASANDVNYQWISCDDEQPIAGATSNAFTATTSGSYTVSLINTVTGCTSFSECTEVIISAVNELNNEAEISIYPNPAGNTINVKWNGTSMEKYAVYDATGSVVLTGVLNKGAEAMDISNQRNGLYFLATKQNTHRIAFIKN